MTAKWDSKKTADVLHKRIYKGVPDKMRSRVSSFLVLLPRFPLYNLTITFR